MREPLVDTVESRAVVGNECAFKTIDIATVTREDLAFTVPFDIRLTRSDYVHALLAYFTIDFDVPGMSKPVRFGTGPHDKYTHWKQTVFYLSNDLAVQAGEHIKGQLVCTPNARNHRDLDITITCQKTDNEGNSLTDPQSYDYHMC